MRGACRGPGGLRRLHSRLIVGRGLPLLKGDGASGTGRQTVAQPVAVMLPHQLRLAVHQVDSALVAGVDTPAAAITFFLVDMNDLSDHVIPPVLIDSVSIPLFAAAYVLHLRQVPPGVSGSICVRKSFMIGFMMQCIMKPIMNLFFQVRKFFRAAQRSRHAPRVSSASMGISSRRPVSISSDRAILLRGDRMEKFSIGPRIPRPGPTLLMQVRDAAKDS